MSLLQSREIEEAAELKELAHIGRRPSSVAPAEVQKTAVCRPKLRAGEIVDRQPIAILFRAQSSAIAPPFK